MAHRGGASRGKGHVCSTAGTNEDQQSEDYRQHDEYPTPDLHPAPDSWPVPLVVALGRPVHCPVSQALREVALCCRWYLQPICFRSGRVSRFVYWMTAR